jgi:ribonuclease R
VRVKVVAANLTKRQLDYEWVIGGGKETSDETKPSKQKKERKK